MANMLDVITRVRANRIDDEDWLYISGPAAELSLKTDGDLGCPEFRDGSNEEIEPKGFAERGLRSTIDIDTLKHCIEWADRLSGSKNDHAALDIIRYYIRFDAWPETLNAPDPPPIDEILRRLDREFSDKLGPENPTQKCRREGCERGVVKFSVLCRRHHFENMRKRPYPFGD